jgi:hypothetical protein
MSNYGTLEEGVNKVFIEIVWLFICPPPPPLLSVNIGQRSQSNQYIIVYLPIYGWSR